MTNKRTFQILLLFALLVILSSSAWAHRIRVFAYESGGVIYAEAMFSGGKPAKNSEVFVQAENEESPLLTGKTDDEGKFSFSIPAEARKDKPVLNIIVDVGEGHKNQWQLKAEDYLSETSLTEDHSHPSPPPSTTVKEDAPHQILVEKAEIQRIVEDSLDTKLAPIKRILAENTNNKPTLQDILGGIGYILGLAGIGAYFHARKGRKD